MVRDMGRYDTVTMPVTKKRVAVVEVSVTIVIQTFGLESSLWKIIRQIDPLWDTFVPWLSLPVRFTPVVEAFKRVHGATSDLCKSLLDEISPNELNR